MGKLLKGNDDFGYMDIAERDVPMWKSPNVSEGGVICRVRLRGNKVEVVAVSKVQQLVMLVRHVSWQL